ncbi:Rossmann-like domain-containing protein [Fusibacter sp. 3D3]|uniref:Rossmann-like domain-containing protein n=1 Tax=Fusibacter sp. 3D3 TaxID=1048380 RepID=UPI000852C9DD|nr:DUF364 domain-containing protein [Fusibacter sp. 3D3]GAU78627.1 uncharacterized conserved protein [Fusibacter sp. 3D3]
MSKDYSDLIGALDLIKDRYVEQKITIPNLEKFLIGNHFNYICLDNNKKGMAYNFPEMSCHLDEESMEELYKIIQECIGLSILHFFNKLILSNSDSVMLRSFLLASLNALSNCLLDSENIPKKGFFIEENEFDFLNKEDVVTVVGYGGIIDKIMGKCKEINVTDLRPKWALSGVTINKDSINYGNESINIYSEQSSKPYEKADVVLITGATIVNQTYLDIIKKSRNARVIGCYGPSAQIMPEFLFQQGFNYISSIKLFDFKMAEAPMNPDEIRYFLKNNSKPYYISNKKLV